MFMKEALNQQSQQCVFDRLSILKSLSANSVPENLKNKLDYHFDELLSGATREVYSDRVTGDSFVYGILPGFPYCINYGTVNTKVGEYKFFSYLGTEGCVGNDFFFNGTQTDYDTFFLILKRQIPLSSFEDK